MYIGDGRKTLKFAQRISASYLLYAMNKLRLSAYTHTPSGIPKLKLWLSLSILHYFSQVLPLLTLVRFQTRYLFRVWLSIRRVAYEMLCISTLIEE